MAVVTVFPDDNKKYLSTDLLREEPAKAGYLSAEVKLTNYQAFKRVCYTCFEDEEDFVQITRESPAIRRAKLDSEHQVSMRFSTTAP